MSLSDKARHSFSTLRRTVSGAAITVGEGFSRNLGAGWNYAVERDRARRGLPPVQQQAQPAQFQPQQQQQQQTQQPTAQNTNKDTNKEYLAALALLAAAYNVPVQDPALIDAMKGVQPLSMPADEKSPLMVNAAGLALALTAHEVHTEKKNLSEDEARQMLRFAAANASMRKNGINIDADTDADRELLTRLAAEYNLKVLNKPAAPAPAPLSDVVTKFLEGADIDEATYRRARDFVIAKNKANPNMLQVELDITRAKAKTLLNILTLDGVVQRIDTPVDKTTIKTTFKVAASGETAAATATPAPETPKKSPGGPAPL
jgi:hypothetical protein